MRGSWLESGRVKTADTRRLPLGAWISATGAVVLLLAVSGRYGFHRDELYFLIAGRNLDWGFVDQPPLAPLVARVSELIFGTSPTALRLLPAIAVGVVSLLAASMARRFGGGRIAQVFAAATAGLTGVLLGEGHLLSTAVLDYAFWGLGLWILVRLLDGDSPMWWIGLGLVVGVGLQNKHTMAFFAAGALLGLLLSKKRRLLLTWHPWAGVVFAGLIALPNIVWQASNGWPQFEMAGAIADRSEGALAFVLFQPALLSITLSIPAFVGLWWLARSEESRSWRPIAAMYVILFMVFLLTRSKAYYVAPMYSALLAAGAVWFEGLSRRGQRWVGGASAVGVFIGLFVALPLLPVDRSGTLDLTGELGETVGWPEMVDQIALAQENIPADERSEAVVFTGSYGEAGAVDVLGPEAGLPAAASGHNNYWHWGPPERHGPIIALGYGGPQVKEICPDLVPVGTLGNPYGVENEVVDQTVWLCLNPSRQLADIWDQVRHYN